MDGRKDVVKMFWFTCNHKNLGDNFLLSKYHCVLGWWLVSDKLACGGYDSCEAHAAVNLTSLLSTHCSVDSVASVAVIYRPIVLTPSCSATPSYPICQFVGRWKCKKGKYQTRICDTNGHQNARVDRGVDPYGTGGDTSPNIWTGGHYHECPPQYF